MHKGIEKMASQASWASRNMAYNLDFIPEDKFDWKPAPKAKSALEEVNHVLMSFAWTTSLITGKEAKPQEVKTVKEAKEALKKRGEEFVAFLKELSDKELKETRPMSWGGEMTVEEIAGLGVIDSIHHRGHITYIQTLLGDEEEHWEM